MPLFRLTAGVLAALLAVASLRADPAADAKPPAKLPFCGLAPSKIAPDLCVYRYRVSTPRRNVRRSSIKDSDITTPTCGWKRPARSRRPPSTTPTAPWPGGA